MSDRRMWRRRGRRRNAQERWRELVIILAVVGLVVAAVYGLLTTTPLSLGL